MTTFVQSVCLYCGNEYVFPEPKTVQELDAWITENPKNPDCDHEPVPLIFEGAVLPKN